MAPVRFPIGIYLSREDFDKLSSPRLGDYLRKIKTQFEDEEKRAIKIIGSLGTFTFQAFRKEFYKDSQIGKNKPGKNKKYGTDKFDQVRTNIDFKPLGPLAEAYGEYITRLEAQERIGTSEAYFNEYKVV